MVIELQFLQCRVWNHSTCSWTTITSDGFEDRNGTVNLITIDRETNVQFVKQKKDELFDKELKYVHFPFMTTQITDSVENAILENARSVAQQIIDEAKSQKPIYDCQNLR